MNTETISQVKCLCQIFLHKEDSKYIGNCDLNHVFLNKKSLDLNQD